MRRAVASFVAISGLVMTSLLTAALSNALTWTPEEEFALNICTKHTNRLKLEEHAAVLVQLWWRRRQAYRAGVSHVDVVKLDALKRIQLGFHKVRCGAGDLGLGVWGLGFGGWGFTR